MSSVTDSLPIKNTHFGFKSIIKRAKPLKRSILKKIPFHSDKTQPTENSKRKIVPKFLSKGTTKARNMAAGTWSHVLHKTAKYDSALKGLQESVGEAHYNKLLIEIGHNDTTRFSSKERFERLLSFQEYKYSRFVGSNELFVIQHNHTPSERLVNVSTELKAKQAAAWGTFITPNEIDAIRVLMSTKNESNLADISNEQVLFELVDSHIDYSDTISASLNGQENQAHNRPLAEKYFIISWIYQQELQKDEPNIRKIKTLEASLCLFLHHQNENKSNRVIKWLVEDSLYTFLLNPNEPLERPSESNFLKSMSEIHLSKNDIKYNIHDFFSKKQDDLSQIILQFNNEDITKSLTDIDGWLNAFITSLKDKNNSQLNSATFRELLRNLINSDRAESKKIFLDGLVDFVQNSSATFQELLPENGLFHGQHIKEKQLRLDLCSAMLKPLLEKSDYVNAERTIRTINDIENAILSQNITSQKSRQWKILKEFSQSAPVKEDPYQFHRLVDSLHESHRGFSLKRIFKNHLLTDIENKNRAICNKNLAKAYYYNGNYIDALDVGVEGLHLRIKSVFISAINKILGNKITALASILGSLFSPTTLKDLFVTGKNILVDVKEITKKAVKAVLEFLGNILGGVLGGIAAIEWIEGIKATLGVVPFILVGALVLAIIIGSIAVGVYGIMNEPVGTLWFGFLAFIFTLRIFLIFAH